MVTVTPFLGKLKVHIRQFYVNEKGESKPGKNGIVLDLEEFEALAKLVPKFKTVLQSIKLETLEFHLVHFNQTFLYLI